MLIGRSTITPLNLFFFAAVLLLWSRAEANPQKLKCLSDGMQDDIKLMLGEFRSEFVNKLASKQDLAENDKELEETQQKLKDTIAKLNSTTQELNKVKDQAAKNKADLKQTNNDLKNAKQECSNKTSGLSAAVIRIGATETQLQTTIRTLEMTRDKMENNRKHLLNMMVDMNTRIGRDYEGCAQHHWQTEAN